MPSTPKTREGGKIPTEELSESADGSVLMVEQILAEGEDEIRLKRMGICEGRQIQLVHTGDPLIIRVVGCRVGVSRRLATKIRVSLCKPCDKNSDGGN